MLPSIRPWHPLSLWATWKSVGSCFFPWVLGQAKTGVREDVKSPRGLAEEPGVGFYDVWGFIAVGSHPELSSKMGSPTNRFSKGMKWGQGFRGLLPWRREGFYHLGGNILSLACCKRRSGLFIGVGQRGFAAISASEGKGEWRSLACVKCFCCD